MDFKVLLEKITPALRNIARKHLLKGFYDENDLYQEMCLYLWQEYSEGLPIGINEAYAIKGCEFHILNYLRKGRKKFRFVSIDDPISEEGVTLKDIIPAPQDMFLSDLDNQLTIDDIRNKGLTKKESEVFSFLIKGYTVREIAAEIGISHVMVVKYKKKIMNKFKLKGYQK
ncbi:MAG TPA: sigma-70 family RNA polymerase sigma factor [Candidatus Omnitrophota bacterium]|nr:sigma-70 family RNA polymerase sigma factor [Candidatus Omnitrophota bacterium]